MNKYDFGYDIPEGTSNSWAYKNIKPNSYILEFGPANGILTKNLKDNLGCIIDIVEIDEDAGKIASQFSRHACIGSQEGNIEGYVWLDKFKNNKYDYIIFLDVIEHLYNGKGVLEKAKKLLKEDGNILISVPNIAHNSIIINLINNKFNYTPLGLLDDTHIRFFTYQSLVDMVKNIGLKIIEQSTIQLGVGENEIDNTYKDVSSEIERELRSRQLGDVYQFLLKMQKTTDSIADSISESMLHVDSLDITKWPINIYLKQLGEKDFSEEKVLRFFSKPEEINLLLNLSEFSNTKEIRIDILGNIKILKQLKVYQKINGHEKILKPSKINGIKVDEDTIVIFEEIPQLIFEVQDIRDYDLYFKCRTSNHIQDIDFRILEACKNKMLMQQEYQILEKRYLATEQEKAHIVQQYQLIEEDREKLKVIYQATEKERARMVEQYELIEEDREKLKAIYQATEKERARVTEQYLLIQDSKKTLNEEYDLLYKQNEQLTNVNNRLKANSLELERRIECLNKEINNIKSSLSWRYICKWERIKNNTKRLFRR
ncbi:MAG: methyltransferase domain-containing protein [Clostridiales bacterium]|nr:methyltransferase domain-containing protein [Clostridiales bacterium]